MMLRVEAHQDVDFNGRVLYVARAPFVSGAERALLCMLRHLDRGRVRPAVVLGERTELVQIIESMNIPVTVMALPKRSRGSLFGWWRSIAQLTAVARRFKPDILHANDVPSCQALSVVGEQLRIPRVVHVRWGLTAHAAAWWARQGCESVLCISQWVRRQLGEVCGTSLEMSVIDFLSDAVDWPAESDANAPLPGRSVDQEPCIGFAGQLIPDKGLDLVIQGMGLMRPEDRPLLMVAGKDTQTDGHYQRQLERLAHDCGVSDRITWMGFLPNINELYAQVHAMACPSRIEPLGLVPLEAARYGIPTFASRDGGFMETIEHNITGVLVKSAPEAWARALRQVQIPAWLADLGKAAHRRTAEQYSPALYQARLMAVYQRLAQAIR